MSAAHHSLSEVLARRTDEISEAWRRQFATSPLRFSAACAEDLAALGEPIALRLAEAIESGELEEGTLVPGSPELREVEKAVAFTGAAGASTCATGYDLAALLLALRDALAETASDRARAQLGDYFEWLVVVAMDAYAHAARDGAAERAQAELESGTPVVLLPGGVPAVFLAGAPGASTLDAVFARLSFLAARVGAAAVVLDAGGLSEPGGPAVLEALAHLFGHGELRVRIGFFACGITGAAAARWHEVAGAAGARLDVAERTDEAVEAAMAVAGYGVAPAGDR